MAQTVKPPSDKQKNAAEIISRVLNIPLPKTFSAAAYWQFISKNMERSKRAYKGWVNSPRYVNTAKSEYYAQKEADWQATHLNSSTWAKGVLDGRISLPSWMQDRSPSEYRRHLRSLGYQSTLEDKLDAERERNWYGLEGSPDDWD